MNFPLIVKNVFIIKEGGAILELFLSNTFDKLTLDELQDINGGDFLGNLILIGTGCGMISAGILGGLAVPRDLKNTLAAEFGTWIAVYGGMVLICAGTSGMLYDAYKYVKNYFR